jgi:hypothetical protein
MLRLTAAKRSGVFQKHQHHRMIAQAGKSKRTASENDTVGKFDTLTTSSPRKYWREKRCVRSRPISASNIWTYERAKNHRKISKFMPMEQIWKNPEIPCPISDFGRIAFLVHLQTSTPISEFSASRNQIKPLRGKGFDNYESDAHLTRTREIQVLVV